MRDGARPTANRIGRVDRRPALIARLKIPIVRRRPPAGRDAGDPLQDLIRTATAVVRWISEGPVARQH